MTDPEFDARFAALRDVEPPAALQRATLDAVARARRADRRPRRWMAWGGAALALAAGLALAVRLAPEERGDPTRMVQRGTGEVAPTLSLRVAVRTSQGLARLDPTRAYAPGDTLQFRVGASVPTDVVLTRDGVPLWRGTVPAGDSDLPVGWSFEPGEGPAIFRVEGAGVSAEVRVPGVLP